MGDLTATYCVDKKTPGFHESFSLGFLSHHEACYVMQEEYWCCCLIAETNKLDCFVGFFSEYYRSLICDDADSVTFVNMKLSSVP
jgi:hypothetical protein